MPRRSLAPILLEGEADTVRLGHALADMLRAGDTVLLEGALGAGKTVLARAILRRLAADPDLTVPSPTYTLAQTYELPSGTAHHFDLYRLEDPSDCIELGLEDVYGVDLALVEWPDRLGIHAPEEWVSLGFTIGDSKGARRAVLAVQGGGALLCRMEEASRLFLAGAE